MKASEIRAQFIQYFKERGHTQVESASLVPQNDPTLLFTNAGMVQFKDVFLGKEKRPYTRATSSQKCVRAGGKHNDLENVGFTARHHTFFEMLGNFSFGDYFKKEAIQFAWEFVTQTLKLPKDRLYVTVHLDDDEAAEIWEKQEGVPKDRIFRFDEDNFWAMGETGPCGPCSEIFYDRGEKYEKGDAKTLLGGEGDRFMEIWNLVFMQFVRDEKGKLSPLPKPSVDTGAGLERLASVLQNVDSNYETDLFVDMIEKVAQLAGKSYDPNQSNAVSFRVISDHARATTFLVADGVLPSNEGRGYVLRRIIRRAIRHGKKLGFGEPFLHQITAYVIDQMKDAYPNLVEKKSFIEKAVIAEEEQFFKTLERGLSLLDEQIDSLNSKKIKTLPGEIAFRLYDTYGFPLDLTRVILAEQGMTIDEAGFEKSMEVQRSTSRKHWKGSGEEAIDHAFQELAERLRAQGKLPHFIGYETLSAESECLALLEKTPEGWKEVQSSQTDCRAIFAQTPFYGESGGQVGDRGSVEGSGFRGEVDDVQKPMVDLVVAEIKPNSGKIEVGKIYTQSVHTETRALTARNHTATHLLHWALRNVLGKHVQQAGSLVAPNLLRFDFSHFEALSSEEIKAVEDQVNESIWRNDPVEKKEMKKDEAVAAGAIAFFGEKYGEEVRVVSVGDYSVELCGGTHVERSSDIHLFKIASESGIAAGVRRIIAYTSKGAFDYLRSQDEGFKAVRNQLKASSTEEVPLKVERILQTEKQLRKEIEKFQSQSAGKEVDSMVSNAIDIEGGKLIIGICTPDSKGIKRMREISDQIKQRTPNAVIVLGMKAPEENKAMLLAATGPSASKNHHAGKIIQKLAPLIDGRGGGKPDLAQAGGKNPGGLESAISQAKEDFLP